jgi:putative two-component system response regulator
VAKILAIDDREDNLIVIKAMLNSFIPECEVITASSGPEGIEKASTEFPDVILLDVIMPGMDGFETCKKLRVSQDTKHIPVVMVTAISNSAENRKKGLEAGADAFMSKPIDEGELIAQVRSMLRIKRSEDILRRERDSLENLVKERTAELRKSLEGAEKLLEQTIHVLANTVETRDPYTAGHQLRTADIAAAIAVEIDMDENTQKGIYMASMIHDIGKINIPSEILNKPGPINDTEFSLIKEHPSIGARIIEPIEFPWPISTIITQHHERLDGSGYPYGLHDEEILSEAKILAVADVMEAMWSHRPYRPAKSIQDTLDELQNYRGIKYDPDIVDAALGLFRSGKIHSCDISVNGEEETWIS